MKCDDDNFVRVGAVLKKLDGISPQESLYMGNLNRFHRPLRNGKWAVSYEVCQLSSCESLCEGICIPSKSSKLQDTT